MSANTVTVTLHIAGKTICKAIPFRRRLVRHREKMPL